jgi:hypothetical protein
VVVVLVEILCYHRLVSCQRFLREKVRSAGEEDEKNNETHPEVRLSIASNPKRSLLDVVDEVVESTAKKRRKEDGRKRVSVPFRAARRTRELTSPSTAVSALIAARRRSVSSDQ